MSEYLAPEQLYWQIEAMQSYTGGGLGSFMLTVPQAHALAATLREYAAIVEEIASRDPTEDYGDCCFCGSFLDGDEDHAPDCLYTRIRKLRGKA